jgi:hypothetical protein
MYKRNACFAVNSSESEDHSISVSVAFGLSVQIAARKRSCSSRQVLLVILTEDANYAYKKSIIFIGTSIKIRLLSGR